MSLKNNSALFIFLDKRYKQLFFLHYFPSASFQIKLPFLLAKVATHLSTNIRSILAKTFNVLMLNVPSLPTVQNYICTKGDPLFSSLYFILPQMTCVIEMKRFKFQKYLIFFYENCVIRIWHQLPVLKEVFLTHNYMLIFKSYFQF